MTPSRFDKLVYYQICDFMYDEFEAQKNNRASYVSFSSFCGVISKKITEAYPLNKKERGIINRIILRISSFFGFDDSETVNYIYVFFKEQYWDRYKSSVSEINSVFSHAKNI